MLLPFGGKVPRDEGAVFVAPNATVLGDVVLGPGSSVWYGAVLRGDDGTLTLGENTNVQDNAVLHTGPGLDVKVGKGVSIGHGAIVHGCTVGDNTLIGMGAIVLDDAVVESNTIVAAGSVVTKGTVVESGWVYAGTPAKKMKQLGEELLKGEVERIVNAYSMYASWYEDENQEAE